MNEPTIGDLLDRYFDLGVAEGREGRNHDTRDGAAQETRRQIAEAIARDQVDKAQAWDASSVSYQRGYDRGVAEAAAENAALRQIIAEAADAIGNGAFIAPTCSMEFMRGLPNEIRLHIATLKSSGGDDASD